MPGSELQRALSGYKASPAARLREMRVGVLAEIVAGFLEHHTSCLAGALRTGPTNGVLLVPVPSSRSGGVGTPGRHPLVSVLEAALSLLKTRRAPEAVRLAAWDCLAARSPAARRLSANRGAFEVGRPPAYPLSRSSVIVVDDVFASGARALSAAAALEDAGFALTAAVPIGRLVRPDHNAAGAAFWAAVGGGEVGLRCRGCARTVAFAGRHTAVSEAWAA